MDSFALRRNARVAARSAAEAAAVGALLVWGAGHVWRALDERVGLWIGGTAAWAASSASTAALLTAQASGTTGNFWLAFGSGMALRLTLLVALMAYGYDRQGVSQSALLLSYSFGVLFFLLLEYRHIKLK